MSSTRRFRTRRFTLIEVTLALIVIAIGLMSIMALFPVGANANRDAIAENYAADAADQMLGFLASQIREDWSFWNNIDDELVNISGVPANIGSWTAQTGTNLYHTTVGGSRVYRMQQSTTVDAAEVIDFDAVIRVWQTAMDTWRFDSTVGTSGAWVPNSTDSQVNIELSWPSGLPYNRRRKAYYSIGVARQ
jgi:type II secretory pathway pseudopilin PulG